MLEWMHWTVQSAIGFSLLFIVLVSLAILDKFRPGYARKGFLPMATTRGDRVFISLAFFLFIFFVWLKYLPDVTAWGSMAASAVVAFIIMKWG